MGLKQQIHTANSTYLSDYQTPVLETQEKPYLLHTLSTAFSKQGPELCQKGFF